MEQCGLVIDRLKDAARLGNALGSDRNFSEETIERLHELVRRIRCRGSPVFRQYVSRLRERSGSLSKREQFLVRRIEGLERVVGA